MSLWAEGEKKNGKRSIYSMSPDPLTWMFCAPILVGTLMMLLSPVIQFVRSWFR